MTSLDTLTSYLTRGMSPCAARSLMYSVPVTPSKKRRARYSEKCVAKVLGGVWQQGNNSPFDVILGDSIAIEVKTIINAKRNQIRVKYVGHKLEYAAIHRLTIFTVVLDRRDGKAYVRAGVGNFNISRMTLLGGLDDLLWAVL